MIIGNRGGSNICDNTMVAVELIRKEWETEMSWEQHQMRPSNSDALPITDTLTMHVQTIVTVVVVTVKYTTGTPGDKSRFLRPLPIHHTIAATIYQ